MKRERGREEMNPLTGCMPCCFMVRWMNLGSLEEGEVHIELDSPEHVLQYIDSMVIVC